MSKTSGDSKRGVVVGFGALAIVIVSAAAYYGGMAGSENAAGTVMQAKRYKADSTTGPTPTPTTADTQQAGRVAGAVADSGPGVAPANGAIGPSSNNNANSNNSAVPNQGAVIVSNQADTVSATRNQSTTGNTAGNQAAARNSAANAAGGNAFK